MKEKFDLHIDEKFERADKIKKALLSEIDVMRNGLDIVHLFISQPIEVIASLAQERNSDKTNRDHDEIT